MVGGRLLIVAAVGGALLGVPSAWSPLRAGGACPEYCCEDPHGTLGRTCGNMDDPICCEPTPQEADCSAECKSYCSEGGGCPV
jgi:hypothetical protein